MSATERAARLQGYAAMAVAATIWGSLPAIVATAAAPEALLVAMRMGFGALFLGAVIAVRRPAQVFPVSRMPVILGLGALLAVSWVVFFRAIVELPGATAVLVLYIFPVVVAVAAPAVLRERRERHVLPLAVVGFAGLAVILVPQVGGGRGTGVAFALAGAAMSAVLVIGARYIAQRVDGPVIAFWQNVTGVVVLTPLALAAGIPDQIPWAWGAFIGVVHTGMTGVLFFFAMARLPAQEAGVLMYLEPVSAVVFAWVLLAQAPATSGIIGGVLVVGAGAWIVSAGTRSTAG